MIQRYLSDIKAANAATGAERETRLQTLEHVLTVGTLLDLCSRLLHERAAVHDLSKNAPEELDTFIEMTPKLKGSTYGSDEYKSLLASMKPALDHHYRENFSHHPEGNPDGMNSMNLLDMVEMFCDWMAATRRHANGDIMKSIDINEKRFSMSPQLAQIFRNTVAMMKAAEAR